MKNLEEIAPTELTKNGLPRDVGALAIMQRLVVNFKTKIHARGVMDLISSHFSVFLFLNSPYSNTIILIAMDGFVFLHSFTEVEILCIVKLDCCPKRSRRIGYGFPGNAHRFE